MHGSHWGDHELRKPTAGQLPTHVQRGRRDTRRRLTDCAQACTADADDDLSEHNVAELVKCIRLCLDCADICATTAGVASRQTDYDANVTRPLLEACIASCKSCGNECQRHAMVHAHCQVCEQACRRCEQACKQLIDAIT